MSLSLAESVTGGALAYSFVKNANASTYFKGSLVAYAEEIKKTLLHVSEHTLKKYSAVSKEVALEMANQSLVLFKSDLSIGVTGFAGPSGENVGQVCFAISSKKREPLVEKAFFKGERTTIIEDTIQMIHEKLYDYISAH